MTKRVFLTGFMGCGKTTIGKKLAQKLGFYFIDTDKFIENRCQKSVFQIFEETGEMKFREIERKIISELAEFENVVISTGGGLPCFFDNMEIMNNAGITIYINLTESKLFNHLQKSKKKRALLKNISDNDLQDFIKKTLSEREKFYNQAKITVHSKEELFCKLTEIL
ncbi:MAG: shikimate kinase [Prevotellaceae bacterium]|nr:shikimate kinase [Prevotellaceae bacterium]